MPVTTSTPTTHSTKPDTPQAMASERSLAQMRIASIKAGLFGAGAVGIAAIAAWALLAWVTLLVPSSMSGFITGHVNTPDIALLGSRTAITLFVNLAVALCSGFFFGVTYRYIVRRDDNLHLGSGAVGAFAFVRSLAQIEALWTDAFTPITWLLITGESFLWFAAARYTLDWATQKHWIEALD